MPKKILKAPMIGLIDVALRPRHGIRPILSHLLDTELLWRPAVEGAAVGNRLSVEFLGIQRHVAEGHIVDHALPQWRYLLAHL